MEQMELHLIVESFGLGSGPAVGVDCGYIPSENVGVRECCQFFCDPLDMIGAHLVVGVEKHHIRGVGGLQSAIASL